MNKKLTTAKNFIQEYLSEYLENLLLLLFGFGLGIKMMVVNHNIDPRAINLDLMPADYVLIMAAPFVSAGLGILINRWLPEDEQEDEQRQ